MPGSHFGGMPLIPLPHQALRPLLGGQVSQELLQLLGIFQPLLRAHQLAPCVSQGIIQPLDLQYLHSKVEQD